MHVTVASATYCLFSLDLSCGLFLLFPYFTRRWRGGYITFTVKSEDTKVCESPYADYYEELYNIKKKNGIHKKKTMMFITNCP